MVRIRQVILGRLEKWKVETDRIEIREELPEGIEKKDRAAWFHVRTTYSGFYRDLGHWKMNVNGEVEQVVLEGEVLRPKEFARKLEYMVEEEKIFKQERMRHMRALLDLEVEIVHGPDDLLGEENYIQSTVRDITDSLLPGMSSPRFSDETRGRIASEYREITKRLGHRSLHSLNFLDDLAAYAAIMRDHKTIDLRDCKDAVDFLKGIIQVLFKQYGVATDLISMDSLGDNMVIKCLSDWEPFKRLPREIKKPQYLLYLLLQMTRAYYMAKKFPEKTDDWIANRLASREG